MQRTDTLIIGAGQAGLAVSSLLTAVGRDHVLIERGQVAQAWRSERWDSLRLLSPNWMTRLPDWQYRGDDPDGFMHKDEVVDFFAGYAQSFGAPVLTETSVFRVYPADHSGGGYHVVTSDGEWHVRNVVIVNGANGQPFVPPLAHNLSPDITAISPTRYRSPDASVPDGGVLVVGASASGSQLANELVTAGRDVVLAVGSHARGIRNYRGRDIFRWLEDTGRLDTSIDECRDPSTAAKAPSMQVVGGVPPVDVDLASLEARGVVLTGRLLGADGTTVTFADDLEATTAKADRRFARQLDDFDDYAAQHGLGDLEHRAPLAHVTAPATPMTRLDLRAANINSVVWATGFRPDYSWLDVPVLDEHGRLRQSHGVTEAAGLYVVGLRFQSRRSSNFIDGVRHDAVEVVEHILYSDIATESRDAVGVAV